MSFPRGRGPWERVAIGNRSAAPDVGRGGARTLFPTFYMSLVIQRSDAIRFHPACPFRLTWIAFPGWGGRG